MIFPTKYKSLKRNIIQKGICKLIPIRYEDRFNIMKWRNEQMYHLRQAEQLTQDSQNNYFNNVVLYLFEQEKPNQILFSYLENEILIGYGGLVHINWVDMNAEISFVLKTDIDKKTFKEHWCNYLELLEKIAFKELKFHKIYTYAFDLRPHLYEALEKQGFNKEAILKEHCFFNNKFIDIIIHEKRQPLQNLSLRRVNEKDAKLLFNWANDKEVRKNAINIESILWENHLVWFNNKLKSNKTKIFILESFNNSIGQVRVDKSYNEDVWVIDFSIDKKYRGKGNGYIILKELIKKEPKMKLKGIVKKENLPSQKVFERLLFHKKEINDKGLIEYIYGK